MIETNLPKDVCVYANNNELGKKYIVIGENKYISISNNFKDLDEEKFLNIIYKPMITIKFVIIGFITLFKMIYPFYYYLYNLFLSF